MAFEADCGLPTVLEEPRVASTAWHLVPGEIWVGQCAQARTS